MKLLVTLIFLAPALASAQQKLIITSGTADVEFIGSQLGSFSASGPNFSMSGGFNLFGNNPASYPQLPGRGDLMSIAGTDYSLGIGLTVNGVPYPVTPEQGHYGPGGGAVMYLGSDCLFTGAGTCSGEFELDVFYSGNLGPYGTCPCPNFTITGVGTVTGNVIPYVSEGVPPGYFLIQHETMTFTTPEPSTASLLGIAAAGLALSRRRRAVPRIGTCG